jgi:chromosomal replication initiation ATPase DnaA
MECNTKLLLTTGKTFSSLDFKILDLKTRLQSFPVANIYSPDDEFLKALLVKQFLERDIIVAPDVIEYIIKHIPRDTVSVSFVVEQADLLSFEEKRRITIPFIKKIIEKIEK